VPSETVIACPVMAIGSPFSSMPTRPDLGDTWRPTSGVRSSRSVQYGAQHRVRAAGDRIFRDAGLRGEDAGDLKAALGHKDAGVTRRYLRRIYGEELPKRFRTLRS
jgi:hypothetical protein